MLTLVIEDNILSSVALMQSTLTALSAFTPVMISLRLGSVAIAIPVSQSREDNECVLHTVLLSGFCHVLVLVTRVVSHSGELLKHPLCLST